MSLWPDATMKGTRRSALLLCWLAFAPAISAQEVGDVYIGNWSGRIIQGGAPRPYDMEITIYRDARRNLRAISLYPDFACMGELTVKSAK